MEKPPTPPPRAAPLRSFRYTRGRVEPGKVLIRTGLFAVALSSPWIGRMEMRVYLGVVLLLPTVFLLLAARRRMPAKFGPGAAAGVGALHWAAMAWVAYIYRPDDWLVYFFVAGCLWFCVAVVAKRVGPAVPKSTVSAAPHRQGAGKASGRRSE